MLCHRVSGHWIFAYCIFFLSSNFFKSLHVFTKIKPIIFWFYYSCFFFGLNQITLELGFIFRSSIIYLYWFWLCWNFGMNFFCGLCIFYLEFPWDLELLFMVIFIYVDLDQIIRKLLIVFCSSIL